MNSRKLPEKQSSSTDITDFISKVKQRKTLVRSGNTGRLIFAIDATASRQPTWDKASHLQANMFRSVQDLGGLSIQLCFFRGFEECRFSPWLDNSDALLRKMTAVRCLAGQTQIARILRHAVRESRKQPVQALVFIGDACEESTATLNRLAGELGVLKTPAFMFQEGRDARTAGAFEQIAKLSGGAYARFDSHSADLLAELLSAVAVYASGGKKALEQLSRSRPALADLSKQMK